MTAAPPSLKGAAPLALSGLSAVAEDYDALICDVWGVLHDGVAPFAGAGEALARFKAERGPVVLVSNAPRPADAIARQLLKIGVEAGAWSDVVTSGDVTRAAIAARAPGPVWAIGPARDAALYEGFGLTFVDRPEDAAFVVCTGPYDDETETPEDYRERLGRAARLGLVFVCANPDKVVQRGGALIYCAGALADVYAELGGTVVMAGKPHAPIYARAFERIDAAAGHPVDRARILAIGDGVPTDVAGANAAGLDLLFIAAGIHRAEAEGADGALDPQRLSALLSGAGASARFAMTELAW